MIKSFRGKVVDGGQDTIVLHTKTGSIGYRIVRLEIIAPTPGAVNAELVTKVYTKSQTSVPPGDGAIDFSDSTLIACAYWQESSSHDAPQSQTIIFDRVTFNQDIYVTCYDGSASNATNYHIELEQFPIDLNESTVATLKDIRNLDVAI